VDSGTGQHVGGYPDLTPCLVLDPLTISVFGRNEDESFLESLNVDFVGVLGICEPAVKVATLLDEMSPLEGVSDGDFGVDLVTTGHEGLGAHLTASPRSVLLERHEITAHSIALAATFGERVLVLVAECGLALGLSFPWGHTTSVVATDEKCNPTPDAEGWPYSMTTSWNFQSIDGGTQ